MKCLAIASLALASCHHRGAATPQAAGIPDDMRLVPQIGHDVFDLAITPDGRYAATTSIDGTIKLWAVETGLLVRTFKGAGELDVSILPDGASMWTSTLWDLQGYDVSNYDDDFTANVYGLRVPADEELHAFPTYEAVAVSPDGTHAAGLATNTPHHLRVFDIARGELDWEGDLDGEGRSLVWTADAAALFGLDAGGVVVRWDAGGRERWRVTAAAAMSTWDTGDGDLALTPDASRVLVCTEGGLVMLDAEDGAELARDAAPCSAIAALRDGKLAESSRWTLRILDAASLAVQREEPADIQLLAASVSGEVVLAAGRTLGLEVRDGDGAVIRRLEPSPAPIVAGCMSPDATTTVMVRSNGDVEVWDVHGARRKARWHVDDPSYWTGTERTQVACALSPDARWALIPASGGVQRLALADGTMTALPTPEGVFFRVAYASDGKTAVLVSDAKIFVVDVAAAKRRTELDMPLEFLDALGVSDDLSTIAIQSSDQVAVIDVASAKATVKKQMWAGFRPDGSLIVEHGKVREGHYNELGGRPSNRVVLPDNTLAELWGYPPEIALRKDDDTFASRTFEVDAPSAFIVGGSADGRFLFMVDAQLAYLVELPTAHVFAMTSQDDDWLLYTEDAYFEASRGGGALLAIARGLDVFRIDQLALRNNRPDLILERLGGDQDEIAYWKARRARRISELGVDERDLAASLDAVPTVEIGAIEVKDDVAKLTVSVAEYQRGVKSLQAYVNGVPLYPSAGTAIDAAGGEYTIEVPLGAGENRIEIGALGLAGVEAIRPMRVVRRPGKAAGDLYFLGFGVSSYAQGDLDLGFAAKDIDDLAEVLGAAGGFGAVHVHAFTDAQVTTAALRDARALLDQAGVDDTVVIAVAGHGVHDTDAAAEYYFLTHDADPAHLSTTAASFAQIEALFDGVWARRRLLLLDTCESGELDPALLDAMGTKAAREELVSRGIRKRGKKQAAPPRPFLLDRDRFALVDLAHATGAVVLSSSRGDELSYESAAASNGLFTQALLAALSGDADGDGDGAITVPELRASVAAAVERASDGLQHPTIDRDNQDAAIALPPVPEGRAILDR